MAAVVNSFGDPNSVSAYAVALRSGAEIVEGAFILARDAKPDAWRGAAADAFMALARDTLPEAQSLADALLAASGTLARYASTQRDALSDFERAQADFDNATRTLLINPFDIAQSQTLAFGAIGRLQQAASIAATELRATFGEEGDDRPWWDPFGWFGDPENPDERVSNNILDDDAFDPDDVAQGNIGDCFMLSSVVALLNTDQGDAFLRENIRWDADKEGYWVTLYSDGEPKEVFVEHVFDKGARQADWEWWFLSGKKPSIAALYESAMRQEYGYDFIDGGLPSDAMEMITGRPVDVIRNEAGLGPSQIEGLREVLDDGGQVVISSPRDGKHEIIVTAPDGSTREVSIVETHSYTVTRIDADGSVWMRNPWGPGNSADGGGEFRVSAEDIGLFWRATSTNITR